MSTKCEAISLLGSVLELGTSAFYSVDHKNPKNPSAYLARDARPIFGIVLHRGALPRKQALARQLRRGQMEGQVTSGGDRIKDLGEAIFEVDQAKTVFASFCSPITFS